MLNQPTLDKLQTLRLHGMAEAFRAQTDPAQRDGLADLSFEERFALLVDQEWTWRQNRTLARRLTQAKFRYRASVEDIDFRTPRGLDRSLVRSLTPHSAWVQQHQNVFLLGPTGVGKSWLACALGEKACRDGFSAFFIRAPRLFRDLALAGADGSLGHRLARLAKIDVLIVDDWVHAPMAESERRDFLEICEDRYQLRSMILTSQLPVAQWHEQIGDPTLADSILDRLVHNAHRIEMCGESMRKKHGGKEAWPYRVRHFIPHHHIADGAWHAVRVEFDFRETPTTSYAIYAARINEGCPRPAGAVLMIRNARVLTSAS